MASRTRGRPPTFGRPARLVALTPPEDTIQDLTTVDPDPAKGFLALVGRSNGRASRPNVEPESTVGLARAGESRAPIVIDPMSFHKCPVRGD